MRKVNGGIASIVEEIKNLKGKSVDMQVNLGRKRVESLVGVIESVYPSVFTIDIVSPSGKGKQSFSYADILCGDLVLTPTEKTTSAN